MERLSIDRCQKVLGEDCGLTPDEIEALRDQLYVLAELVVKVMETNMGDGDDSCHESIH